MILFRCIRSGREIGRIIRSIRVIRIIRIRRKLRIWVLLFGIYWWKFLFWWELFWLWVGYVKRIGIIWIYGVWIGIIGVIRSWMFILFFYVRREVVIIRCVWRRLWLVWSVVWVWVFDGIGILWRVLRIIRWVRSDVVRLRVSLSDFG